MLLSSARSASPTIPYIAPISDCSARRRPDRVVPSLRLLGHSKASRRGDRNRGRKPEVAQGYVQCGGGPEHPAEANAIDHSRQSPVEATKHGGRDSQTHGDPAKNV